MTEQLRFDLITMGRIGIDIYPLQFGVRLESVESFSKSLGGSPTNVAVAAARHGLRSAVITRTGDDPFGRYAKAELARLGVSSRYVEPIPGAKTTVAFSEILPPDDFPLYFYRDAVSPELQIEPDQLDLAAIGEARAFWTTATSLCRSPSRESHHVAWNGRGRSANTILDLDYRAGFWPDAATARAVIGEALGLVTIAIGNQQECEVAVGETDPVAAADALLRRGVEVAVVKLGPRGVYAKSRVEEVLVPPTPVDVVNGLGAGDSFGGAFVFGRLSGWSLRETLSFASVAGAIVASRRECAAAMPTTSEVKALLDKQQ